MRTGPHHPNAVAVLVTEEGDGAHGLGFLLRRLDRVHLFVGDDISVDQRQDLGRLFGTDAATVGEVETQTVRSHERTLLANVITEHRTESGVQEVRRRVVATRCFTSNWVNRRDRGLTGVQLTAHEAPVGVEATGDALGIEDLEGPRLGHDHSGVGNLPARLGIERRGVQKELPHAVLTREQREHFGLNAVARDVATHELSGPVAIDQLAILRVVGKIQRFRRCPGTLALFLHRLVKGCAFDTETRLRDDFLGQFNREAVRVVQFERHVAREHGRTTRVHVALGLFEEDKTGTEGARKTGLFSLEHLDDEVAVLHQHGIGAAHLLNGRVDEGLRQLHLRTGPSRGEDGAANDAPQHVAATFVGGQHTVRHEHRHGATVVGNASDRNVGGLIGAVGNVERARRSVEERREKVGREDGLETVQDRESAFEADTGVDVLLRKFRERAVGALVVLGEDEVPEFDKAVFATGRGAAVGPELRALVKEDLRARSTRPRRTHFPEVVGAETLDS